MSTFFKAVLLHSTFIYTMLYIMAVDSLSLFQLFVGLLIAVALIYICTKCIKEHELNKLLGNDLLNKIGNKVF